MVGITAEGVDMWVENCDGNWLNMDQAKKLEIDDRRSLDLPSRIKIPVTTNDDYWDETIIFGESVPALKKLASTLVSWHSTGRNIAEYRDLQRLYEEYANA